MATTLNEAWYTKLRVMPDHVQGKFALGAERLKKRGAQHALEITSIDGTIELGDYVAWVVEKLELRCLAEHPDLEDEVLAIGYLTCLYEGENAQKAQASYVENGEDVPGARSSEFLLGCNSQDFSVKSIVGRVRVNTMHGANPCPRDPQSSE